jgi:polynucleotide 5'-kinase involved in rRNA processing
VTRLRHLLATPPDWDDALAVVERGTVLVVGPAGAGRTALAGYLVGQLDRAHGRVGWIDADPGQAEVGVPGCLGLAMTGPWEAPAALWHVGDLRAAADPLSVVTGTTLLARRAREQRAEVVVIDSPAAPEPDGSPESAELLWHLAVAAEVDQVVAFAGTEPFLLSRLHELARRGTSIVQPVAGREAPPRTQSLEKRLAAHLATARVRRFGLNLLAPGGLPEPGTVVGFDGADGLCFGLGVVEEIGRDSVAVVTAVEADGRDVARITPGRLSAHRAADRAVDQPGERWRLTSGRHPSAGTGTGRFASM